MPPDQQASVQIAADPGDSHWSNGVVSLNLNLATYFHKVDSLVNM